MKRRYQTTAVVGVQWGDEGKGAATDRLVEENDIAVRCSGGANAGHTLCVGENKYVTHIAPAGIVHRGKINLIGPMVLCDLGELRTELAIATQHGATLFVDRSAPLALPIHKLIDKAREGAAGTQAIGTTARGIGPGYEDFWSRRGVRMGDLVSADRIRSALTERGYYAERCHLASNYYGLTPPTLDETITYLLGFSDEIKPILGDTREIVHSALANGKTIVFEGAQGIMLDPLMGGQPYTTSSLCTPAGIAASFGVTPHRVVGIVKAYATRVGGGPFPTELIFDANGIGELLRKKGHEYGATTGRPRRCGWLDLVAMRYACRVGQVTELCVTKVDILSGIGPIQAATNYTFEGQRLPDTATLTGRIMREAVPEIVTVNSGWDEDITGCRNENELPIAAQMYLAVISSAAQPPVTSIGVGPDRNQCIWTP